MSVIQTLYYRRVGAWPAVEAAAFEVTRECPNPRMRYAVHGRVDCEPNSRGIWTTLTIRGDQTEGVQQLREMLGLSGATLEGRFGNLIGDSISLLRACCQCLGWPDEVDAAMWLEQIDPQQWLQRAAIMRACA